MPIGNTVQRRTIGNFQNKNPEATFKASQNTQIKLNNQAQRLARAGPQRLNKITAWYYSWLFLTNSVRGVHSSPNVLSPNRQDVDKNQAHRNRSLRSVGLIRTDMQPRHHFIPIRPDDSLPLLPTPQRSEHAASENSREMTSVELSPAWRNVVASWPLGHIDAEIQEHVENANEHVMALLIENNDEINENSNVSIHTLIKSAIDFALEGEASQAALARSVQEASGDYGAHVDEVMSVPVQEQIIRDWIALNLFGQSMNAMITEKICGRAHASSLRSRDLNEIILREAFRSKTIDAKYKPWVLTHLLIEEVPMIGYFETYPATTDPDRERYANMKLDDFEWGYIHAGLRFAQSAGLGLDLDLAEAATLGEILLAQLQEGVAPTAWWELFRLPAIIRYAQDYPNRMKNTRGVAKAEMEARALIDYASAHEKTMTQYFPLLRFKNLLSHYQTRPQLAEVLRNKSGCPSEKVPISSYLDNPGDTYCYMGNTRSIDEADVDDYTKALRRMAAISRGEIWEVSLPDLNQKFQQQNDAIADTYQVLDKAFAMTAWNRLAVDDIDFINRAEVKWAQVEFSNADAIRNSPFVGGNLHARESLTQYPMSNVEFFEAQDFGKAKRIYALHNQGQEYTLTRINEERDYYAFFPVDLSASKYANYKLIINSIAEVLKTPEQNLVPLFDSISKKHRDVFAQQLHEYGYEKTAWEKATEMLLSLVPFYTCISSIKAEKLVEAVTSCSSDSISLLPLINTLAKTSIKLAHIIGEGSITAIHKAASGVALRDSLQMTVRYHLENFIQYAILPASEALNKETAVSLSLAALYALDPGIGFIASMGRASVQRGMMLYRSMASSSDSLKIFPPSVDASLEKLPPMLDNAEALARLRDPENIPVVALGGDRYQGLLVHVRIQPETGEPFGHKYVLLPSNRLDPIPSTMARQLRNSFKRTLDGKGEAKQAVVWAHNDKINAALLRRLQQKIKNRGNLENLAMQCNVRYAWLRRYIADDGKLSALGNEIVDAAEAGPSRIAPSVQKQAQTDHLATTARETIAADKEVASTYIYAENKIITSDDGTAYLYNIDQNKFFNKDVFSQFKARHPGFSYALSKNGNGFTVLTKKD